MLGTDTIGIPDKWEFPFKYSVLRRPMTSSAYTKTMNLSVAPASFRRELLGPEGSGNFLEIVVKRTVNRRQIRKRGQFEYTLIYYKRPNLTQVRVAVEAVGSREPEG